MATRTLPPATAKVGTNIAIRCCTNSTFCRYSTTWLFAGTNTAPITLAFAETSVSTIKRFAAEAATFSFTTITTASHCAILEQACSSSFADTAQGAIPEPSANSPATLSGLSPAVGDTIASVFSPFSCITTFTVSPMRIASFEFESVPNTGISKMRTTSFAERTFREKRSLSTKMQAEPNKPSTARITIAFVPFPFVAS